MRKANLLLSIPLFLFGCAGRMPAESIRVYFGGNSTSGIYFSTLDLETGAMTAPALAGSTSRPTFLAFSPDGRRLYSTRRDSPPNNKVRAFSVDPAAGLLTFINEQSSGGEGPTFVKVDPTGGTLFVANYTSSIVASYPINADGSIAPAASTITHSGPLGPHPNQNAPHPHWIGPDPRNRWVYVPDLGMDKVVQYDFNKTTSVLTAVGSTALPAGYGPRHMAFHPNGQWAYVTCELARKVTLLYYNPSTGALTAQAHYDADDPALRQSADATSEVNVHPSGKFVYVGNRGQDTIAVFAVNPSDGTLTLVEREPARVAIPRHFNVDPKGRWLVAGGQNSSTAALFGIDPLTGALSYTGTTFAVPSPQCVMFEPYLVPTGAGKWILY